MHNYSIQLITGKAVTVSQLTPLTRGHQNKQEVLSEAFLSSSGHFLFFFLDTIKLQLKSTCSAFTL